jgi:hypothetical protein
LNTGMRFSANAAMPSRRSSLAKACASSAEISERAASESSDATRFRRAFVALHGQRRELGNVSRQRERGDERIVGEVLHEPDAQRVVGVDRAAREQEVARRALTHQLHQPPDVARTEMDAELAARNRQP